MINVAKDVETDMRITKQHEPCYIHVLSAAVCRFKTLEIKWQATCCKVNVLWWFYDSTYFKINKFSLPASPLAASQYANSLSLLLSHTSLSLVGLFLSCIGNFRSRQCCALLHNYSAWPCCDTPDSIQHPPLMSKLAIGA